MNTLFLRLLRFQLGQALKRTCPARVPRSGRAGERVDCMSIFLDKESEPHLWLRAMDGWSISCLKWTGSEFGEPTVIDLRQVDLSEFSATHFVGTEDLEYESARKFLLGRIFRLPYLKLRAVRVISSIDQFFFNKKKLITKQRIDLLRLLVARRLDGQSEESPIELMTALYSIKWVLHPDRDSQQSRVRFYLDSLVDTGELKLVHHSYVLTGKALQTIEVYEEQERKHTESIKAQRAMLWLTLAIALLTAAQAGLVKFPILIDLSAK